MILKIVNLNVDIIENQGNTLYHLLSVTERSGLS